MRKVNRIIGPGDGVLISGVADCPRGSAKEKMTLCSPSWLSTCCWSVWGAGQGLGDDLHLFLLPSDLPVL